MTCDECGRERDLSDVNDYSPLQVLTGSPVGWYSGSDGEMCGACMANLIARANR